MSEIMLVFDSRSLLKRLLQRIWSSLLLSPRNWSFVLPELCVAENRIFGDTQLRIPMDRKRAGIDLWSKSANTEIILCRRNYSSGTIRSVSHSRTEYKLIFGKHVHGTPQQITWIDTIAIICWLLAKPILNTMVSCCGHWIVSRLGWHMRMYRITDRTHSWQCFWDGSRPDTDQITGSKSDYSVCVAEIDLFSVAEKHLPHETLESLQNVYRS